MTESSGYKKEEWKNRQDPKGRKNKQKRSKIKEQKLLERASKKDRVEGK